MPGGSGLKKEKNSLTFSLLFTHLTKRPMIQLFWYILLGLTSCIFNYIFLTLHRSSSSSLFCLLYTCTCTCSPHRRFFIRQQKKLFLTRLTLILQTLKLLGHSWCIVSFSLLPHSLVDPVDPVLWIESISNYMTLNDTCVTATQFPRRTLYASHTRVCFSWLNLSLYSYSFAQSETLITQFSNKKCLPEPVKFLSLFSLAKYKWRNLCITKQFHPKRYMVKWRRLLTYMQLKRLSYSFKWQIHQWYTTTNVIFSFSSSSSSPSLPTPRQFTVQFDSFLTWLMIYQLITLLLFSNLHFRNLEYKHLLWSICQCISWRGTRTISPQFILWNLMKLFMTILNPTSK